MPFRGRGRFTRAFEGESGEGCRRGQGGDHPRYGRGRGGMHRGGPPPFSFGGPFWARPPFAGNEHQHPHGPPPHTHRGAHGPHGHHGPHGPHGPHSPHGHH